MCAADGRDGSGGGSGCRGDRGGDLGGAVRTPRRPPRHHRRVAVYDVVAVTRATVGIALDGKATVVGALNTVSAAAGPGDCDRVAVVTYTTADGHRRPVLVGEAALLSLGRGVLADSSWRGTAFPGRPAAQVSFTQAPRMVQATWLLGYTDEPAINSSLWLQGDASTVC